MNLRNSFAALLLGATSTAALASSAYAADAVATDTAAAGFDWSGVYIGFGGGVGAVLNGLQVPGSPGSIDAFGGDGFFGEATIGYDYLVSDRFLIGAFADARFGNLGGDLWLFGPDTSLESKYGFDGGLRLGYLVTPNTLGFVSGGYSWQRLEISAAGDSLSWNADGYFVGAGLETVLADNWTLKSEYRYSNYGSEDPFGGPLPLQFDTSTHTFSMGANYRFGAKNAAGATIEAPAYSWTGFYIGGAIGAGAMVTDQPDIFLPIPLSGDGVRGEISAGYDHELGDKWIIGVVADAHIGGISTETDLGGGSFAIKADYGFDILARVGAKLSDSTLAYALGGYSWQHFELSATGGPDDLDGGSSGFSIGAGLETAVADRTSVNLEYRYSKFDDQDFGTGFDFGFEPAFHTVRVGAKYKFN